MILTRDFDLGYRAISREIEMLPDRASGGPGPGGIFGLVDTIRPLIKVNSHLPDTRRWEIPKPKSEAKESQKRLTSNV